MPPTPTPPAEPSSRARGAARRRILPLVPGPGQPPARRLVLPLVPGPGQPPARRLVLPLVPGLGRPPTRQRPLPDAAAVRRVSIPDCAPPYDDAPAVPGPPRRLTLATAPRAVTPRRARPEPGPSGSPSSRGDGSRSGRRALPEPEPRRVPPEPGSPRPGRTTAAEGGWPNQFAQVLAETLAGSRPEGQIVPWTTDQARRRIRQLGPRLAADVQPRVRRVVTSQPAAGVVEMAVVVGFGPRIRALAVRLERDGPHGATARHPAQPARWVCTAIEAA